METRRFLFFVITKMSEQRAYEVKLNLKLVVEWRRLYMVEEPMCGRWPGGSGMLSVSQSSALASLSGGITRIPSCRQKLGDEPSALCVKNLEAKKFAESMAVQFSRTLPTHFD